MLTNHCTRHQHIAPHTVYCVSTSVLPRFYLGSTSLLPRIYLGSAPARTPIPTDKTTIYTLTKYHAVKHTRLAGHNQSITQVCIIGGLGFVTGQSM